MLHHLLGVAGLARLARNRPALRHATIDAGVLARPESASRAQQDDRAKGHRCTSIRSGPAPRAGTRAPANRLIMALPLRSLAGLLIAAALGAADPAFATQPAVKRGAQGATVSFAVAAPIDVEVAVLAADGAVVRHLAAGVLGAAKPPPAPLRPGLAQELAWDGMDDYGKPASGTFSFRVRTGMQLRFDKFLGAAPYNLGSITGVAADEEGTIYVLGGGGRSNQGHLVVRAFDGTGTYLKELVPFPADLPPGAMKDVARWDEARKGFVPRNLRNLNPDFYGMPGGYFYKDTLTLVSASRKHGLVLSNGDDLLILDAVTGAVKGQTLSARKLGSLPNSGGGPVFLAIAPDGGRLFVSGPYSCTNQYGYVFDANAPPGRIYIASLQGTDKLAPFVTVPVEHKLGVGGAWSKALACPAHFTAAKGPVHQVAVDATGRVYVADRERGGISVYDAAGAEVGRLPLKNPHNVAIHPATGAIYATQYDCLSYNTYQCTLVKFAGLAPDAKPVASLDFPRGQGLNRQPSMALSVQNGKTVAWVAGVQGGLAALEDSGDAFKPIQLGFAPDPELPLDWNRLCVDYARDEVYISDGTNGLWRFDGTTGAGVRVRKDGKPFLINDLSVGYDGLLYACVSGVQDGSAADYSGPLWRLDRELKPAPFSGTGSHVLSPYIYSRMGVGFAERGLGVGPDGSCYIGFMYDWVAYAIGGFGGDGKPLPGKYLKEAYPAKKPEERKRYPAGTDGAIIGPIPQMTGNIRVDLQGKLYVGMMLRPKDFPVPAGFEKDQAYRVSVGAVVTFDPVEGGCMPGAESAVQASEMKGAIALIPGLAPFSSATEAFGRNSCCVCRVPRFDLDRFGRLALPNAITNSVLLYDNAGNLISEFGAYGNFDSRFAAGKDDKPAVVVPEIPLGWPTGAGFSAKHLYVNDTYNRRAVQLDYVWKEDVTRPIP